MSAEVILSASHILEAPGSKPDIWVHEAVFGHRFITEQEPYMLVLEALAVCGSRLRHAPGAPMFPGPHPDGRTHEIIKSSVRRQPELRFLLFRGQSLDVIARNPSPDQDAKLQRAVRDLNEGFQACFKRPGAFDYLLDRFQGRFDQLVQAVRILRGTEIDAISNRRWTSRFLVPRGPTLQLGDFDVKKGVDRRFFGRGGEIVWLMLNRSTRRDELAVGIRETFFDDRDSIDRLARELSPPPVDQADEAEAQLGYLPYRGSKAFGRLAEDWLAVLRLKGFPAPQKLEPLTWLTALNLVRYFSEAGQARAGIEAPPLPLDLCDGRRADLRKLCRVAMEQVRDAIDDATAAFVRQRLNEEAKWREAEVHADLGERSKLARQAIHRALHSKHHEGSPGQPQEREKWLDDLLDFLDGRRSDPNVLVKPLGEKAGFVVSRQKVGAWFCGTDEFLEALVLANVHATVTIEELVSRLHDRYGLVIGPTEAIKVFDPATVDIRSFEVNLSAFETRLTGLGYVKRLSDDCAFVSNPFVIEALR